MIGDIFDIEDDFIVIKKHILVSYDDIKIIRVFSNIIAYLKNGYKCYNWALGVNNNDLSYTNDIKDDYKIMKHKGYQVARKNKGKVIIKNGVKYVEMNGNIYNYYSYANAGILIPEEI